MPIYDSRGNPVVVVQGTGANSFTPQARRGPAVQMPMQARTRDQDVAGAVRMACSKCQITYYVVQGRRAECPLCAAEAHSMKLQAALSAAEARVEALSNQARALQGHVDVIDAIKSAVDLADTADVTFLKTVLYRYREDHTAFALRATKGGKGGKVNGYMLQPKYGEIEAHACSSVGGVAIAGYYDEACKMQGQVKALALLMQALHGLLAVGE